MGGMGYSYYSSFCYLLNINDVQTTFEGDNKVLLLQTAKFLLKGANNAIKGKKNDSL